MVQASKRKDPKHNKHKAPTVQPVYQETTSPFIPEANPLHKEDEAVEEKQSYAMVKGLLQVLVHLLSHGFKSPPANLVIRHQDGQHFLSTVCQVRSRLL